MKRGIKRESQRDKKCPLIFLNSADQCCHHQGEPWTYCHFVNGQESMLLAYFILCEREEHLSTVDLTAVSVCRHIFFLNLHLHTIESVAPYTCIFYFSVHYFIFVRAQNKCLCPAADGRESEHVKVNCS